MSFGWDPLGTSEFKNAFNPCYSRDKKTGIYADDFLGSIVVDEVLKKDSSSSEKSWSAW